MEDLTSVLIMPDALGPPDCLDGIKKAEWQQRCGNQTVAALLGE